MAGALGLATCEVCDKAPAEELPDLRRCLACAKAVADTRRVAVVSVETTAEVEDALARLVTTGLFGRTVASVAEELLRDKLRQIELEGWLNR